MNGLVRFTFCRSAATILSYMLWQFALFQRFSLVFPIKRKKDRGKFEFYNARKKKNRSILVGEIKNLNYSLFYWILCRHFKFQIIKVKNIYIQFFTFDALKDFYFFDAKIIKRIYISNIKGRSLKILF